MSDTIRTKASLKAFFETGDKPTQQEFADLIESLAAFSTPYNAGNLAGPTAALDYANGLFQKAALTGNVSLNVPSSGVEGARLELWLTASGANRALDLNASIKTPTDSAISFPKTLTSGKSYDIVLRYNGSSWWLASLVGGF